MNCSNLTDITCFATIPPTVETNAFTDFNATLHVPSESVELYKITSPWSNFYNIVEIDDNQPGDVNCDGEVSIADVNAVIDIILGSDAIVSTRADVNGDGEVSVADVNTLIDLILSQ